MIDKIFVVVISIQIKLNYQSFSLSIEYVTDVNQYKNFNFLRNKN